MAKGGICVSQEDQGGKEFVENRGLTSGSISLMRTTAFDDIFYTTHETRTKTTVSGPGARFPQHAKWMHTVMTLPPCVRPSLPLACNERCFKRPTLTGGKHILLQRSDNECHFIPSIKQGDRTLLVHPKTTTTTELCLSSFNCWTARVGWKVVCACIDNKPSIQITIIWTPPWLGAPVRRSIFS